MDVHTIQSWGSQHAGKAYIHQTCFAVIVQGEPLVTSASLGQQFIRLFFREKTFKSVPQKVSIKDDNGSALDEAEDSNQMTNGIPACNHNGTRWNRTLFYYEDANTLKFPQTEPGSLDRLRFGPREQPLQRKDGLVAMAIGKKRSQNIGAQVPMPEIEVVVREANVWPQLAFRRRPLSCPSSTAFTHPPPCTSTPTHRTQTSLSACSDSIDSTSYSLYTMIPIGTIWNGTRTSHGYMFLK